MSGCRVGKKAEKNLRAFANNIEEEGGNMTVKGLSDQIRNDKHHMRPEGSTRNDKASISATSLFYWISIYWGSLEV